MSPIYAGRVGLATLVCGLLVMAGYASTTGGRTLRASTVSGVSGPSAPTAPSATSALVIPTTAVKAPTLLTTSSMKPRPKVRNVTVSGVARGADGVGYRHVLVGFRRTTCPACAPMTVMTDDRGAYAVSVPPDSYVVACVATPHLCTVAGSEELTDTVTVRSNATLDMAVQAGGRTAAPPPSDGLVYGHVLMTTGLSVPHTTIQLVRLPHWLPHQVGPSLSTGTVPDGSYELPVDRGVFLVGCITPIRDYRCGPVGGDGNPFTVTVAAGPQRIDFVLCRSADYPGCLSR